MTIRALIAVLVVLCTALAGCRDALPETDPDPTPPHTVLVGLAFDFGSRGDKSFSDAAAGGIDRAKAKLGVQVIERDAALGETAEQKKARLRELANSGCDPVIAVGFAYSKAVKAVAGEFPDTDFAVVDDDSAVGDNIAGLVFANEEASFLVGVIAGSATRTGEVGFIGGVDEAGINSFEAGFRAGVRKVNPMARIRATYLSTRRDFTGFRNPEAARAAALSLYDTGVDIIFHASGASGQGLFQAAREAHALAIGVDSDQYFELPAGRRDVVLTSMIKNLSTVIYDYIEKFRNGTPVTGRVLSRLSNDGVGYSPSNPAVKPYQEVAEKYRRKIIAGEIKVPRKP